MSDAALRHIPSGDLCSSGSKGVRLQPHLAVIAEASGTVIETPPDVVQRFTLEDNQVYFVQFPNPRHVVTAGGLVSVVIDRVRLEHIPVQ